MAPNRAVLWCGVINELVFLLLHHVSKQLLILYSCGLHDA